MASGRDGAGSGYGWRREAAAEALLTAAMQACKQAGVSVLQLAPGVPPDAANERACGRLGFERADSVVFSVPTS